MVAQARELLGLGLYTPAEAAMYARVPTSTVSRWIHGTTGGLPAVRAQVPASDEKVVTFLDFIQSLAIRAIRTTRKVPLNKIRETVERAHEQYGIEYPFARRHTTYLLGDEVLLDLRDFGLVQVTGKQANQLAMKKVVEIYL